MVILRWTYSFDANEGAEREISKVERSGCIT